MRKFRNFDAPQEERLARINYQIRVPNVRVVMEGKQFGIMSSDDARALAKEYSLDLVEIVPNAKPPVCQIMDYNKFKFEHKQKEKIKLKKQRESADQIKELRLRPMTDKHDVEIKANRARQFLLEGKKVQFSLQFRGRREMCHKEQGFSVIESVLQLLQDVSDVERPAKMESNRITCRLAPKK